MSIVGLGVGGAWVNGGGAPSVAFPAVCAVSGVGPPWMVYLLSVLLCRSAPQFGAVCCAFVGWLSVGVAGPVGVLGAAAVFSGWWRAAEAVCILWYVSSSGFDAATTHLTWWGMGVLALHDVWPGGGAALFVVSGTIACGVVAMSLMGCNMLLTTHAELGPAKYIGGNTVVHYYPLVRALFSECRGPPLVGVGITVAYASLRAPGEVYGCSLLSEWVIRGLLIVTSLVLAAVCVGFRSWRARGLAGG